MYKPVDPKVNFPKQEESIVQFWEEQNIFQKSVSQREGAPEFSFYDGSLCNWTLTLPLCTRYDQRYFPRYKTMRGYHVERR